MRRTDDRRTRYVTLAVELAGVLAVLVAVWQWHAFAAVALGGLLLIVVSQFPEEWL